MTSSPSLTPLASRNIRQERARFHRCDQPWQDFRGGFVPPAVPPRIGEARISLAKAPEGAGVVERGSLENCWRRKALVGSNPTPSVFFASPLRRGATARSPAAGCDRQRR